MVILAFYSGRIDFCLNIFNTYTFILFRIQFYRKQPLRILLFEIAVVSGKLLFSNSCVSLYRVRTPTRQQNNVQWNWFGISFHYFYRMSASTRRPTRS